MFNFEEESRKMDEDFDKMRRQVFLMGCFMNVLWVLFFAFVIAAAVYLIGRIV